MSKKSRFPLLANFSGKEAANRQLLFENSITPESAPALRSTPSQQAYCR